jgi:GNAT superfamily N-acetyltransferase
MIRPYNPKDLTQILPIAEQFHQESASSYVPFNPHKVAHQLELTLSNPEQRVCWVAELDGEIIGSFYGVITPHYFADALMSNDLWWYVSPDHRGGTYGIKLLKKYISWANIQGVEEIGITVGSGIEIEKTSAMLERVGFEKTQIALKMKGEF